MNLTFPIVAVFLLDRPGSRARALATAAFIGVAVLGVVVAGFVLVPLSDRLARDLGDVAARLRELGAPQGAPRPGVMGRRELRAVPRDAGDFLERSWHLLTLASLAGNLSVFAVLVVSLRALRRPASQVTVIEAFAAGRSCGSSHRSRSPGRHRDHRARPDRRRSSASAATTRASSPRCSSTAS